MIVDPLNNINLKYVFFEDETKKDDAIHFLKQFGIKVFLELEKECDIITNKEVFRIGGYSLKEEYKNKNGISEEQEIEFLQKFVNQKGK